MVATAGNPCNCAPLAKVEVPKVQTLVEKRVTDVYEILMIFAIFASFVHVP